MEYKTRSTIRLVIWDGFITGLLFCWVVLLVIRTNTALWLQDMPVSMREEVEALAFIRPADAYDIFLTASPMLILIFWRSFRLMSKINAGGKIRIFYQYLHVLLWFFIIFLTDLVVLDGFIYSILHLPVLGIEHLLTEASVSEFQSFSFHLSEHFTRPEAYLANLLLPAVLLLLYTIYRYFFVNNSNR